MTDNFRLRKLAFHTIQVLQETKRAFRSKDLADLSKYLEEELRETTETLKNPGLLTHSPLTNRSRWHWPLKAQKTCAAPRA